MVLLSEFARLIPLLEQELHVLLIKILEFEELNRLIPSPFELNDPLFPIRMLLLEVSSLSPY
jgi:hypothetical protein